MFFTHKKFSLSFEVYFPNAIELVSIFVNIH